MAINLKELDNKSNEYVSEMIKNLKMSITRTQRLLTDSLRSGYSGANYLSVLDDAHEDLNLLQKHLPQHFI